MRDQFRVYEPHELGPDGYPPEWHDLGDGRGLKHLVREQAGHRCERCRHPYQAGAGEWSPCDRECSHAGPIRVWLPELDVWAEPAPEVGPDYYPNHALVEARWRILTVHHLTGHWGNEQDAKRDCRWWNLAALCQRCHLVIQGTVVMERPWPWPHTPWFREHAAGWYAWRYAGLDLTRDEVRERLDELLALGQAEEAVERMAL